MVIKGADGHDYRVTGQNQGNFNTVGAAGGIGWIAEKVLGGNPLGNLFGTNCRGSMGDDAPITRYEANLLMQLQAKDSHIALLESNIYTDSKIADVYERLNAKINGNKDAQEAINREQAVLNATTTSVISCMKGQIAQLMSLTDMVVPQSKVVDTGCCNS
ncbi:MAG: hypothetical protein IJN55_08235 [Alistipes sp.]|nr:hypothetical protein [Alistipes sp.]MBR7170404.1 hypothetical protein [Alistipes sp.]